MNVRKCRANGIYFRAEENLLVVKLIFFTLTKFLKNLATLSFLWQNMYFYKDLVVYNVLELSDNLFLILCSPTSLATYHNVLFCFITVINFYYIQKK